MRLGNGIDIDVKPNQASQELHSYATLQEHTKIIAFEPHLHAPGVRMCLEAIWGHNILTLNCVGYDHNWVKQYVYEDDAAPLLPKGTIVHLIGFLDTTAANKNPADPRNWAGGGRRSIANMFIDLGYSVSLTEEQFQAEMAKRRAEDEEPQRLRHRLPAVLGASAPPVTIRRPPQEQARTENGTDSDERGTAIDDSDSCPIAGCCIAIVLLLDGVGAQTRFMYSSGQSVSPAYEGWWPNEDGSFTMFFGYMNSNWLQEFDVPIGPRNNIEPGGPDQGQPTHFYPRRNPFLFTIRVPKDFGSKELIWTLTTNGKTERAYASLKTDYQIDKQVISTEVGGDFGSLRDELRTNIPPELKVEGELSANGQGRRCRSRWWPLPRIPTTCRRRRPAPEAARGRGGPPLSPAALYRPPSSIVASSGPGLRFSWIVYRGNAAAVKFSPDQMKTWTDTRAYANSPWSPPYTIPMPPADNKWVVQARFREPGMYVLARRCQ